MEVEYQKGLVFVSVGLSFIGCYLAASFCEQLRLQCVLNSSEIDSRTAKWYVLMAISMGVLGIWSMHLLSFVATDIDTAADRHHLDIRIHFGLCLVMLAVTLFFSLLGLFISSFDAVFLRTRLQVMELYHPGARNMSAPQLRQAMKQHLLRYLCQKDLGYILLGSLTCTIGCVLNHYLCARGLAAQARVDYQPGIIAASIVVCALTFFASHLIVFRFLALTPNAEWLRVITSFVMAAGSCGTSYLGLAAREYRPAATFPPRTFSGVVFNKRDMLFPLLIYYMAVAGVMVVYLLSELRKITYKHLSKLKPQFDNARSQSAKLRAIKLSPSWSISKWISLQHYNRSWSTAKMQSGSSSSLPGEHSADEKGGTQSEEHVVNVVDIVEFQAPSSSDISTPTQTGNLRLESLSHKV